MAVTFLVRNQAFIERLAISITCKCNVGFNLCRGQAEREFRVEVEAFGHVRHKNLVRLLGYCIEGTHRILVYEYVDNGNLEQWLHGALCQHGYLTWEARIKILLGTAKA